MKTGLQLSVAALALAGTSLFASVPANADSFSYGPRGGIGFSYQTGGYCDSLGCPEDFWDYPIAYCPVYFAGEWYRGPFYYRYWQGDYYYWIRGDWRHDEWSGDRPDDACVGRFGPAQDYDFYVDNGFIWLDTWRLSFFRHHHHHDHDHDHDHDGDHDHDHHGDHGHGHWDHGGDHGVVWDHGGDHNPQPGGSSGPPPASGTPTPLGGSGGHSNSGGPLGPRFHDHVKGDESGGSHHEDGPPTPSNDSSGGGRSGGHHFEGGARNAPQPLSSPPPNPPPPPPPPPAPPSSGESHHDSGSRGDFGRHTQKP